MLTTLSRSGALRIALLLTVGMLAGQWIGCSERSAPPPPQPPAAAPPRTAAAPAAEPPPSTTPSRMSDPSLHEPAQRAMPSVVNIFTSKRLRSRRPGLPEGSPLRRFFGAPPDEPQTATSLGSGVIVTQDGLILTNN